MQIISTNIGKKQRIVWQGKELYTGIFKYPANEPLLLGFTDVFHDEVMDRRYHGGFDKACYLYSANHYRYWKEKYPNLDWHYGMFGENITIDGFDEAKVHIGDVFRMGTALVQITQPRQPCFKLGIRLNNPKAVKHFVTAELPGAYIRVLENGTVKIGDALIIEEAKPQNFTLKEVFHFLYNREDNSDAIKKAVAMPELAASCRNDLIR